MDIFYLFLQKKIMCVYCGIIGKLKKKVIKLNVM